MKKLVAVLLINALGAVAIAQEITPYAHYKINEGVSIEVKDLKRVEKYGWDNFEVTYRLKNETNYDLFKVDLTIYLVDKNDNQVGMIEIHDFRVDKNSDKEYVYTDLKSPFVNQDYAKLIVVKNSLEVFVDSSESERLAKIDCEPTFSSN